MPILEVSLGDKKALPVRQLTSRKEFVEKFPFVKKVILDGTERPVQRPPDNEKQKEYYSGKKKRFFGFCYAMDGGYKGCNPYIERHLAIFVNYF